MSQAIIDAMAAKLASVTTVGSFYDAVGGRIFNTQGTQNCALPYCSFWLVTAIPDRSMTGPVDLPTTWQFDLWGLVSAGASALGQIEQLLYNLLEQADIAPAGFDRGITRVTSRMQQSIDEDAFHIIDLVQVQSTDF